MDIKSTFLRLTNKTYPHGTEAELNGLLPDFLDTDEFGNRFYKIGESTCMFTSHLDTATQANTIVNHVIDGDIIRTDGRSILGADDKAGVTIMLYMIQHKVPGLYYFFIGEEVGCVGSRSLSSKLKVSKIEGIQKVISFDRRGTGSVITFQSSSRCCSDKFAEALSKELNKNVEFKYSPDPTGIYTDSAQFTGIYPECTNISVGYRNEHTFREEQDCNHLEQLARTCLIVDWENLPVERDPSVYESRYRSYGYGGCGAGIFDEWDEHWSGSYVDTYSGCYPGGNYYNPKKTNPSEDTIHFQDDEYIYISSVTLNTFTKNLINIELAKERLDNEKILIHDLLTSLDVEFQTLIWDGIKLQVIHKHYSGGHTVECFRDELAEFLPSLDFWKKEILDRDVWTSVDI